MTKPQSGLATVRQMKNLLSLMDVLMSQIKTYAPSERIRFPYFWKQSYSKAFLIIGLIFQNESEFQSVITNFVFVSYSSLLNSFYFPHMIKFSHKASQLSMTKSLFVRITSSEVTINRGFRDESGSLFFSLQKSKFIQTEKPQKITIINQTLIYDLLCYYVHSFNNNQFNILEAMFYTFIAMLLTLIIVYISTLQDTNSSSDLPFEKNMDFQKFMGIWYSIASLPNAIQSHYKCPQSKDTLENQLVIDLAESCIAYGKNITSKSKAVATIPGYGNWTNWNGPLSAPYYIIEVEKDYQWTLIGQPSRKGFWIMSRKPKMEESLLQELMQKGAALGFNISKVEKADQSCFMQEGQRSQ